MTLIFKIKCTSKYKPIVCAFINYTLNSREKFEPGPGFEPWDSRFLKRLTGEKSMSWRHHDRIARASTRIEFQEALIRFSKLGFSVAHGSF